MKKSIVLGLACLCLCMAQTVHAFVIVPTTTVAVETGNNTSTANSFTGLPNGAVAATNVSKVPTSTLLYPGAKTVLYVHDEPWWGEGSHIDIGYSSQDPNEVHKQVLDMKSRGVNGVIPDWYGPGSYEDKSINLLMKEAEADAPFKLVVSLDQGAVQYHSCWPGCSTTQAVINLTNQLASEFFGSSAYATSGGRPILFEFGMETLSPAVDWAQVQAGVSSNPVWIHRNTGGYSVTDSSGAYSWLSAKQGPPDPNYDDAAYLRDFYSTALGETHMHTLGSIYKGFDDSEAKWGTDRHIVQKCGQTWLNTFATANKYFSSSKPLEAMQVVTWNDYEEGSEIETGIDNCLSISTPTVSGSTLNWSVSGSTTTLDHYTVFVSSDNSDLMVLQDNIAPATFSLNLSSYGLPNGLFLFVKAVGKPSIVNHLSGSVSFGSSNANAHFVSQSVPSSMVAGQTYPIVITMENNGGVAWNNSISSEPFGLGSQNPQDNLTWGLSRDHIASTATIQPGQSYTFNFNVVAPSTPSTYNFQWQMLQEHVQWFGDFTANVAIAVVPAPALAKYISQVVPATMTAAQTYPISITMQNNGGVPWTNAISSEPFGLGSQNPQDNLTWGLSRVHIASTATVQPGQSYTFNFNVVAPSTPSTYNFQWQMLQEHVQWFGDFTANVAVIVQGAEPVPVLINLSPNTVAAGGNGFTLFAQGNNFMQNSVMQWNGSPYKTNYYGSGKLGIWVPKSNISQAGTVSINVVTPGGGTSATLVLTIGGNANAEFVPINLNGIQVYPNPWRSDKHAGKPITFANLTVNSTVKIFTISGHHVKTLPTSSSMITWDLTNDSGDEVASGLYLYLITADNAQKKTGQIAIVK